MNSVTEQLLVDAINNLRSQNLLLIQALRAAKVELEQVLICQGKRNWGLTKEALASVTEALAQLK